MVEHFRGFFVFGVLSRMANAATWIVRQYYERERRGADRLTYDLRRDLKTGTGHSFEFTHHQIVICSHFFPRPRIENTEG